MMIKGHAPMHLHLEWDGDQESLMRCARDIYENDFTPGMDPDGWDLGEAMGIFINFASIQVEMEFTRNFEGHLLHCVLSHDLFEWEGIDPDGPQFLTDY